MTDVNACIRQNVNKLKITNYSSPKLSFSDIVSAFSCNVYVITARRNNDIIYCPKYRCAFEPMTTVKWLPEK